MTLRGAIGGFANIPVYKDLPKTLKIHLLQSTMIWNSLLVDSESDLGLRPEISAYLQSIKAEIDAYSERNFVYLIATRPRVRVIAQPRYRWFSSDLIIHIAVGSTGRRERITVPSGYFRALGFGSRPEVTFTPRSILIGSGERQLPIPIHTLLLDLQINLGLHSKVTYVGKTEEPGKRAIDGNHRGLSDTLTLALENQDDVFFFSSLFHARYHAETADHGISFIISNSMTDDIPVEPEADLIEKLLIYHFNSVTQTKNRKNDVGTLRNTMQKLRTTRNIHAIELSLEVDDESEYFCFGNMQVNYAHRHAFLCKIVDGELHYEKLTQ
jgi:hypothetical protein